MYKKKVADNKRGLHVSNGWFEREALPVNDANIDREMRCNKSIRGFERAC